MALIICPKCQKQISDKAPYCVHCGFVLHNQNENRRFCAGCGNEVVGEDTICPHCGFQENAKSRLVGIDKKKIMIGIAISLAMLIAAIALLTTRKFEYYIENISYYTEQYEETKSHSSGFLGSSYASLASRWKDMRNEAITYIALHSVGAIALSIGGGVGLYRGIKRLKNVEGKNNGIN